MWKRANDRRDMAPLISSDSSAVHIPNEESEESTGPSIYIRPRRENTTSRVYIGTPCSLVAAGSGGHVVFPTGIFYKSITNANAFPVEVCFDIEGQITRVSVAADSTCHDIAVLESPGISEPRGQRWCERFGVITKQLLEKGVIERRDDGSLVVWKTFRHSPSKLTPFGIWCNDKGNSPYTVLTADQFASLCESCLAHPVDRVRVTVSPLFKAHAPSPDTRAFVDLEARFPFLLNAPPTSLESPV